jgi:hypothetical protein
VAGLLAGELLAGTGEVAQRLLRHRRHEARPNETMGQQIRQPRGVIHVGLASRHGLNMVGVGQHQLKVSRQDRPDRLPVHPGGLHRDARDTMAGHSESRSSSAVVVAKVSTNRITPPASAKRTQATMVSRWMSSPAQRV